MGLLTWRGLQRTAMVQWMMAVFMAVLAVPFSDAAAAMPTVSSRAPVAPQSNPLPVISASYQAAAGGEIDTRKISLTVDSINVTSSASVSSSSIRYTPATKLADGNHIVTLWVADKSGSMANATWSFSVDTSAPAIANTLPASADFVAADSVVSAALSDKGTGIDSGKTVLLVDGVDVSASAQKSTTSISYKPAAA